MLCSIREFFITDSCVALSSLLLSILFASGTEISKCFSDSDTLKWNRTFNFDNRSLVLNIAASNDPAHWIVNYIFEFLARERLGYKHIQFVPSTVVDLKNSIEQLLCSDASCKTLPSVHINLLLWVPIGVDIVQWASSPGVSDHGPLGPSRQWELFHQSQHRSPSTADSTLFPESFTSCSEKSQLLIDKISEQINQATRNNHTNPLPQSHGRQVGVYELSLDRSTLYTRSSTLSEPPLCDTSGNASDHIYSSEGFCRTESYHAVKVSWAHLGSASPTLFQLTSRIHFTNDEFAELLEQVRRNVDALPLHKRSHDDVHSVYRENACRWLRLNPAKWKRWTKGWDQKLNLTVAGMFSVYGKWVLPGLQGAAEEAIRFVNEDPDYFLNSEYALRLDVRNLSCQPGVVLSEYFKILADATDNHLIGTIAALCSDSIEALVELANFRKKLIISPTVATARFLEQKHYPYFFRTVPAMTQANYVLLRLFLKWGWRRVVVFRKRDHFFKPRIFQAEKIEIIADIQMEENQLMFKSALNSLENLKRHNSRIFMIEYGVRGTYLILCAAYHLNMHFGAGYVWFLNPWLSSNWWAHPSLGSPKHCTDEQMANISSWTFTVGHQWVIPQMLHSLTRLSIPHATHGESQSDELANSTASGGSSHPRFRRHSDPEKRNSNGAGAKKPQTTILNDHGIPVVPRKPVHSNAYDPTEFYLAYTTDAVMSLASALVNLLKENPSAISALDQPSVAEAFRKWVSRTEFGYSGVSHSRMDNEDAAKEEFFLGFGFQSAGEFYGLRDPTGGNSSTARLRFNSLNERIADHWLLKQHRSNTTLPIFVWFANNAKVDALEQRPSSNLTSGSSSSDKELDDLRAEFALFERQMSVIPMDGVNWSTLGGPPHDGSIVDEDCAFPFLSNTLKMGCTGATAFVAVLITSLALIPIVLVGLYYRRKLQEAEKRTRKPFEELCAELADLDMPMESIVLNRQIGQGAFGLVFGGEAKNNGCWEAVAVKVIDEKATYEGKIDFLSEAKLMRSLKHPNVVRLIGISLSPKDNLYLIMELMLLGDLKTYLLSRRILAQRSPDHDDIRPSTLTRMAIDIAQGVIYLHGNHLIHRDIACRNCLVGSDRVVKIGDFGLTREAEKNKPECYYRFTRNCELPIRWMSPEAVQYGIFSVQSDIWSYGITLYEIVTFGVFPYSDMGDVEVVERVKRMEFSIADFLPSVARNTIVWQLIKECCQHQWKNRPSSMRHVLQVLHDHPDCIRPFLTNDPPKPVSITEPVSFPQMIGACIKPEPSTSELDPTNDSGTRDLSTFVTVSDDSTFFPGGNHIGRVDGHGDPSYYAAQCPCSVYSNEMPRHTQPDPVRTRDRDTCAICDGEALSGHLDRCVRAPLLYNFSDSSPSEHTMHPYVRPGGNSEHEHLLQEHRFSDSLANQSTHLSRPV